MPLLTDENDDIIDKIILTQTYEHINKNFQYNHCEVNDFP